MHLLAPFIVQNFKKIYIADLKLRRHAILRPQMARLPRKVIVFRKPINKPCRVHSCLSTWSKSEADVNPLMRY